MSGIRGLIFTLVIFASLHPVPGMAAHQPMFFKQISLQDGLTQNTVMASLSPGQFHCPLGRPWRLHIEDVPVIGSNSDICRWSFVWASHQSDINTQNFSHLWVLPEHQIPAQQGPRLRTGRIWA